MKSTWSLIKCDDSLGPSFGGFGDIRIENNSNKNTDSYSVLGYSYKHPNYKIGSNEAQSFLAGSRNFQVNEIERSKN